MFRDDPGVGARVVVMPSGGAITFRADEATIAAGWRRPVGPATTAWIARGLQRAPALRVRCDRPTGGAGWPRPEAPVWVFIGLEPECERAEVIFKSRLG